MEQNLKRNKTSFIHHGALDSKQYQTFSINKSDCVNYNDLITNDEMFNDTEHFAKDFVVNKFVPELTKYLEKSNPAKFKQWHSNCCRQVAIFSCVILKEILPDYEWNVFDCELKNNVRNSYFNHAFTIGKNKDNDSISLLVDLERAPIEKNIFFKLEKASLPYPHGVFEEYKSEEFIKQISFINDYIIRDCMMNIKEFYTNKIGNRIIKDVLYNIKINNSRDKQLGTFINEISSKIANKYK